MCCEGRLDHGRQHRHPIFVPFACPHDDLVYPEIDAFRMQSETLQQAQAGTIK
jgi:hypothetical protein